MLTVDYRADIDAASFIPTES